MVHATARHLRWAIPARIVRQSFRSEQEKKMQLYVEWAQIACLLLASVAFFAWAVTGRNRDWLFTLGNVLAIATVAVFMLKSFIPQ